MKLNNSFILYFILIAACCFRFYDFFHIPFTHDEFSALFRTEFSSFRDLIRLGVFPDGHPAGIQIFLYYWTKLVGWNTWLVKLPFTLAGIAAVYLMYRLGKLWYNETVGLIGAAFLAGMQIMVMYALIARPYISGHFLVLLTVFFWSLIILKPEKYFIRNATLFILSATLSAYNHHFSLLFVAILGIYGVFLVNRKYRLNYILTSVFIFILYIPHLPILFSQLSIGGIEGWLAKPEKSFFLDYLRYLFNFSIVEYVLVAALFIWSFFQKRITDFSLRKLILFFVLFFLPFLIGYLYSVYFSAVIQFSVLIFSTPFLIFVVFGHIPNQKPLINAILAVLIIAISGYGLIVERQHYKVFYNSPYERILIDAKEVESQDPNTPLLIYSHPEITDYYLGQSADKITFTNFDSFESTQEFIGYLDSVSNVSNQLYFGGLSQSDPETVSLIRDYFSGMIWQKNYYNASTYLFSKDSEDHEYQLVLLDFKNEPDPRWSNIDASRIQDSLGEIAGSIYNIDPTNEWSVTFRDYLMNGFNPNKNDFIDITVKGLFAEKPNEALLIATLKNGDKDIFWAASDFSNFLVTDSFPQWAKIHLSIKLSDIKLISNKTELNVFVWNKGFNSFMIDDFCIMRRPGNPIIYGLFEKIE